MGLVQIENQPGDKRTRAMLASPDSDYSIRINRDILDVLIAGGVGKVKQNPVGIDCRFNRGRHRSAERDLHAQIRALLHRRHTLHRRCSGGVLCRGTRQQER
jgi:hypothetical protein